MTSADADAVLDRMEADRAFADRVRDAGGPEAARAILAAEGFEVTAEEMRDAVLGRYREVLTPEQLDTLAGGLGDDVVWVWITEFRNGIPFPADADLHR